MDFTPHTDADVARMLEALGLSSTDDLFAHLPAGVRVTEPLDLPEPPRRICSRRSLRRPAGRPRSRPATGCIPSPTAMHLWPS